MSVENYIRESLRLFANDPPDTTYQHGFLDAVVATAEVVGIHRTDPDVQAALSANRLGQASDQKVHRLRFGENSPS